MYGVKGIAAYAVHATRLGFEDEDIYRFIFKSLAATTANYTTTEILPLIIEAGHTAVAAMSLLDRANTSRFGDPVISAVKTGTGNRPGIFISGHDLLDLHELLEHTHDSGIDIYTHGEMLPSLSYPELRKYKHLYGNYGNSWYLQQREFAAFNGPIIMTRNCITPVREEYRNRIYTTGTAIREYRTYLNQKNGSKDFASIIRQAKNASRRHYLKTV